MKSTHLSLVFLTLFLFTIAYVFLFKVYIYREMNTLSTPKYEITVDIKECINCLREAEYKKSIRISNQEMDKNFSLTDITEILETRVIIGRSKENTNLKYKGIDRVIIFPNEREKLETFNFDTGDDLNEIEDGQFIWTNYYSDAVEGKLTKDMLIELDTIVK